MYSTVDMRYFTPVSTLGGSWNSFQLYLVMREFFQCVALSVLGENHTDPERNCNKWVICLIWESTLPLKYQYLNDVANTIRQTAEHIFSYTCLLEF